MAKSEIYETYLRSSGKRHDARLEKNGGGLVVKDQDI